MEPIKTTRVQRTEEDIFKMMEEFERSESVSIKDFCEMNDISNATFYNWQKQYRSKHEKSEGFVVKAQPAILSMTLKKNECYQCFQRISLVKFF